MDEIAMDVFLGTILPFGFQFAPNGWMQANGQTLPVNQYQALFTLLGITYGGNGSTTFMLPNLCGRLPMHQGQGINLTNRVIGQVIGTENTNVLLTNLPPHAPVITATATSALTATTTVNLASAPSTPTTIPSNDNAYIGASAATGPSSAAIFSTAQGANPVALKGVSSSVGGTVNVTATAQTLGSGTPLGIVNPVLVLNFCVALQGLFPSRN
jgi:microcystin-dependent protein